MINWMLKPFVKLNTLNPGKIYEYELEACKMLDCRIFEDCHDKYRLADVVLLAVSFHAFRKNISD